MISKWRQTGFSIVGGRQLGHEQTASISMFIHSLDLIKSCTLLASDSPGGYALEDA